MISLESLPSVALAARHSWLAHFFGLDDLSGPYYGFWSGAGSDLGELAIVGGLVSIYRRHNCHVRRCPRIGVHRVDGTPHVTCRRHHPALRSQAPSAADVAADHAKVAGR